MSDSTYDPYQYGMRSLGSEAVASDASSSDTTSDKPAEPTQANVDAMLFAVPDASPAAAPTSDDWAVSSVPDVASVLRELPALELDTQPPDEAFVPNPHVVPPAVAASPTQQQVARAAVTPESAVPQERIEKVSEAARQAAQRRTGTTTAKPKTVVPKPVALTLGQIGRRRRTAFVLPVVVLSAGIAGGAGLLIFAKSLPFAVVVGSLGIVGSLLCRTLLKDS